MLDVAARVNGDHTACAAMCMYVYRRNATFRGYFLLHAACDVLSEVGGRGGCGMRSRF